MNSNNYCHTGLVQVNTAYRCTVNRYRFTDTHNKSNNNITIIQLSDAVVTSKIASTQNGSHCRATLEFTSAPQSFTNLSTNLRQNKWLKVMLAEQKMHAVVLYKTKLWYKIHENHIYHSCIFAVVDHTWSFCHRLFLKLRLLQWFQYSWIIWVRVEVDHVPNDSLRPPRPAWSFLVLQLHASTGPHPSMGGSCWLFNNEAVSRKEVEIANHRIQRIHVFFPCLLGYTPPTFCQVSTEKCHLSHFLQATWQNHTRPPRPPETGVQVQLS